jgi:glycosyltransferase involved in cell wall biosynthesis
MDISYKPKVSVCIPSYNHEKYIRECLASILAQTFQDFEIIITDDCSTDETVNIIGTVSQESIYSLDYLCKNTKFILMKA